MASDPSLLATVAEFVGAAFGILFLVVVLWIAIVLSSNPVGELASELVYLTSHDLRGPGLLVLSVLGLEAVEHTYPLLQWVGLPPPTTDVPTVLNAIQSVVLLVATLQVLFVVLRYTRGGLERRIRGSIETLAFLQGQRRRKRRT